MSKKNTTITVETELMNKANKLFPKKISYLFENFLILLLKGENVEQIANEISDYENSKIDELKCKKIHNKYIYLNSLSKITKELKTQYYENKDFFNKVYRVPIMQKLIEWMNEFSERINIEIKQKYLDLIEALNNNDEQKINEFLEYRYPLTKTILWLSHKLNIKNEVYEILNSKNKFTTNNHK